MDVFKFVLWVSKDKPGLKGTFNNLYYFIFNYVHT